LPATIKAGEVIIERRHLSGDLVSMG